MTFRLPLSAGDRVSVVGDFNEWRPDANRMRLRDGVGSVTLTLAVGRTYRFRYVTADGYWFNDLTAPLEDNGYGVHNSVLKLAAESLRTESIAAWDPCEPCEGTEIASPPGLRVMTALDP